MIERRLQIRGSGSDVLNHNVGINGGRGRVVAKRHDVSKPPGFENGLRLATSILMEIGLHPQITFQGKRLNSLSRIFDSLQKLLTTADVDRAIADACAITMADDCDVNLFQGKRNSFNGLALPYTINFQDAALESVGSIALDKITYTTESACEDALASFKNIQGPQCQDLLWDVEKLANQIGQGVTGGYEATVREGEKVWEQTKKDAAAASDEAARLVQAEKDAAEKEVARLAKEACLIAKCQCGHAGGCCIHCRYCAPRVCHWGQYVGGGCTGDNRDSSNCC